jgi:hypothetical protein
MAAFLFNPLSIDFAKADHSYLEFNTEYQFLGYISEDPYGKLNIIVTILKLINDHSSSYDWYFYELQVQSVPGKVAFGSNYVTAWTRAEHKLVNMGVIRWWSDYDPTTTHGYDSDTVSASVTISNKPVVTLTESWTYVIPWVTVWDWSDYDDNRVEWRHEFNKVRPTAEGTYKAEPGFVVRTSQGYRSLVDGRYYAEFAAYLCGFVGCFWYHWSEQGPWKWIDSV